MSTVLLDDGCFWKIIFLISTLSSSFLLLPVLMELSSNTVISYYSYTHRNDASLTHCPPPGCPSFLSFLSLLLCQRANLHTDTFKCTHLRLCEHRHRHTTKRSPLPRRSSPWSWSSLCKKYKTTFMIPSLSVSVVEIIHYIPSLFMPSTTIPREGGRLSLQEPTIGLLMFSKPLS